MYVVYVGDDCIVVEGYCDVCLGVEWCCVCWCILYLVEGYIVWICEGLFDVVVGVVGEFVFFFFVDDDWVVIDFSRCWIDLCGYCDGVVFL